MRILISARLYGRGGTETHLLHLSKLLTERGHEVILACRYADRSVPLVQIHRQLGVKRLATPFDKHIKHYRWSTVMAIFLWTPYLLLHRADLILTLETTRFLQFLSLFLKSTGQVVSVRAGLPVHPSEQIANQALHRLNGFITESALQAQACRVAHPQIPALGIPLLGNIPESVPIRRPFDNQRILRVAFLGRYDRKKGIFRLLEIWSGLQGSNIRLDFYGHGSERENLQNEVIRLGLQTSVSVNGGWTTPDELSAIMERVDLVVLPSEEEGLPVVLMEAMAYGVPFVACDVGAVRTYADDNPDIKVVPLDNQQFSDAIKDAVNAIREGHIDPHRLQNYYQERFAYSKLAQKWIDALEDLPSWVKT